MTSFLEQNKDFVLKLKIKIPGGESRIRRVCLPRIANADGTRISYEELIGLAIVFTFPEEDPQTSNARKYNVSLTYYDDEEDLITIGSTEELTDAIELCAGEKFMKITACVKPKISHSTFSASAAPSSSARGRSDGNKYPPAPPVRVILETFAGIISKVANDLPGELAAHFPPRPNNKTQNSSPNVPATGQTNSGAGSTATTNNRGGVPTGDLQHDTDSSTRTTRSNPGGSDKNKTEDSGGTTDLLDEPSAGSWRSDADCLDRQSLMQQLQQKPVATPSNSLKKKPPAKAKSSGHFRVRQVKVARAKKGDEKLKSPPFLDTVVSAPKAKLRTEGGNKARSSVTSLHLNTKDRSGSKANANESKESTAEKRPFIHGRHTCDACLTSPIIGTRYSAINLPEYDLCKFCFQNYRGSEISFKPMELRYDKARQNHWHYRYQHDVIGMKRRNHYSQSRGQIHSQDRPRSGVRGSSQPKIGKVSLLHPVSSDSTRSHNRDPTNFDAPGQSVGGSDAFDAALKEAIRRSLDGFVAKENPSITKNDEGVEVENNTPQEKSECTRQESVAEDMDLLKEAIRRSLDDVVAKESPTITKTDEDIQVEKNDSQKILECTKEESVVEDQGSGNRVNVPGFVELVEHEMSDEERTPCDEDECIRDSTVEDQGSGKGSSSAQVDDPGSAELVEHETIEEERAPCDEHECIKERVVEDQGAGKGSSVVKGDIPHSVRIVDHETTEGQAACDDSTFGIPSESDERKIVEAMEQEMDTNSVDSEKLLLEANGRENFLSPITKTAMNDHSDTPFSKQSRLSIFQNESFASDAVGNGVVAEEMGKTLDKVAGAISEMLFEFEDLKPSPIGSSKEIDIEAKMGQLIANSDDESKENADDNGDDTDWSVVKSVGTNGTTESQQMGQAAQMLGSALFNSEMQTSEENASNFMSSGSSLSIPSSVPTDFGSSYSGISRPPQGTRWASELGKLRELGFENEEKCVEILERLNNLSNSRPESTSITANIGIVVNELLELNIE